MSDDEELHAIIDTCAGLIRMRARGETIRSRRLWTRLHELVEWRKKIAGRARNE